jgi:hypothetical protein
MMFQAAALFASVNIALLCTLIVVYVNSFRRVQSEFTAGLLFFAAVFLIQNVLSLYSYLAMFMFYASDVGALVLEITVAQTTGLAILVWMSCR